HSIAIPPLGCGNGGLEWSHVKREIDASLSGLQEVEVLVYEPTPSYHNAPKREGLEALTPARAMVVELVRRYSILGMECTNLEVQKLGWFLQRAIQSLQLNDPLHLRFEANKYGPYADSLRHLLDGLDGSFLHCERRLSDAGPFEPIWFEESKRESVAEYLKSEDAVPYLPALEKTSVVIEGFESPLGMELLATVDWLLSREKYAPTIDSIRLGLSKWPGGSAARRKMGIFDDRLIEMALSRLQQATLN
ncbi:MAG TPA: Appr-1-p processing protein, partial [Fibrobacteria bacterium]|nr:Appr-1-p processing protein [Fibrobacteria bacterium]